MKKFFQTNTAIKLFSLLAAILMWLYVVQVENPTFESTLHGIPILLENEAVLEQQELVIVSDRTMEMDVRVKGRRQTVSGLRAKDVTAVVNLQQIQNVGVYSLPVNITFPADNVTILESRPHSVSVTVERLVQKTYPVDVMTVGTPKDSFFALPPESDVTMVTVHGPESIVGQVAKIVAPLDIDGKKGDVEGTVALRAYKENGEEVDQAFLSFSQSTLTVSCRILPTKTVPVRYRVTGQWNSNTHDNSGVLSSVKEIRIAASQERLEQIQEIYVGELNLAELTVSDHSRSFPIILPEDVYLADEEKWVTLTAVFDELQSKEVSVEEISVRNTAQGLSAQIVSEDVVVSVFGTAEELKQFSDQPVIWVDLTEYQTPGQYSVSLRAETVTLLGEQRVEVLLSPAS